MVLKTRKKQSLAQDGFKCCFQFNSIMIAELELKLHEGPIFLSRLSYYFSDGVSNVQAACRRKIRNKNHPSEKSYHLVLINIVFVWPFSAFSDEINADGLYSARPLMLHNISHHSFRSNYQ